MDTRHKRLSVEWVLESFSETPADSTNMTLPNTKPLKSHEADPENQTLSSQTENSPAMDFASPTQTPEEPQPLRLEALDKGSLIASLQKTVRALRLQQPRPKLEVIVPKDAKYTNGSEALDMVRKCPEALNNDIIRGALDRTLDSIWMKIYAAPSSYVMTRDEFSIFNFFRHRDAELGRAELAMEATRRYWDNLDVPPENASTYVNLPEYDTRRVPTYLTEYNVYYTSYEGENGPVPEILVQYTNPNHAGPTEDPQYPTEEFRRHSIS
ncbi:uncharacterized protein GGS25DRAFT_356745 [Hypoxylon fragiforme]|uniref:uncharacterized protein n=1 Tax=Hypoxylon fragiforme TaxID=63214 RepID=UPI0020C67D8D|nr:uncharacterized protein GGS25DRAFT_356745 [Hypoxylon fragiforme]KAI2605792.1 hypothetical protein GGS25DRAFT_356745 [Hypoxylon fragiforme]